MGPMHPHDAQSSLDDIRRLQDRTREQVARQGFALSYVLLAALGLLVGLVSVDLQNPWRTVAFLIGFGVFVGVGIVHERRALVKRKPTGMEWLFWVGLSAGLMLLFSIFRIAGWALFGLQPQGLLSQAAVAAAATAVTYVAVTPLIRRAFTAIVLRDGGRS
jgi:membrane protein YdbS with pleckstrin-like domain